MAINSATVPVKPHTRINPQRMPSGTSIAGYITFPKDRSMAKEIRRENKSTSQQQLMDRSKTVCASHKGLFRLLTCYNVLTGDRIYRE
jgi:hypothetical protein